MIKNPGRTCSTDRDCNDKISHQYFQGHCNSKKGALDGYCNKENRCRQRYLCLYM